MAERILQKQKTLALENVSSDVGARVFSKAIVGDEHQDPSK